MSGNVRSMSGGGGGNGWRPKFSPEISIGQIAQIAVILFGLLAYFILLGARVDTLEKGQSKSERQSAEMLNEMRKISGIQERILGRLEERDRMRRLPRVR